MKGINILVAFLSVVGTVWAQNSQTKEETAKAAVPIELALGASMDQNGSLNSQQMFEKYQNLAITDTVQAKFTGEVLAVCQAKGCWMKLALQDGQEAMVRFKDYGFFMPKDIAGRKVVVSGLAFVSEMSVEDQRHYAKDAGTSDEEIAEITTPKKTFGFEAEGVVLKQ